MKKYEEDKFFVINRKYIEKLSPIHRAAFDNIIASMYLPDDRFYVCKQSESYADRVLKLILEEK